MLQLVPLRLELQHQPPPGGVLDGGARARLRRPQGRHGLRRGGAGCTAVEFTAVESSCWPIAIESAPGVNP